MKRIMTKLVLDSANLKTSSKKICIIGSEFNSHIVQKIIDSCSKKLFELGIKKKDLKYGQNKRSDIHLKLFGEKPFDAEVHKKYLQHERIENLKGLEVELIYEWEVGSMLIFDRSHLHCSSSVIEGKKIGIATFTKR